MVARLRSPIWGKPLLKPNSEPSAALFKGIALFTPGGDLIYCIDPTKQQRWHMHLCVALQEQLDLPEPPHFLVPCFTATVDRWQDAQTQQIHTVAEAAPTILRYQGLLNVLFGIEDICWQPVTLPEGLCDPAVLSTYRQRFPQLWQTHDLIVRYESVAPSAAAPEDRVPVSLHPVDRSLNQGTDQGYVLRLFVSGHSAATERTLQNLHHWLEQSLGRPYTLKVIDVFQHPEQAELDQVSATPTLVKVWPRPVRRIVGNLDNIDQLLRVLGSVEPWQEE